MRKTIKYILLAVIAIVAIRAAFYTENLTEKTKREQMAEYKPAQLVEALFRDSIATLDSKAVTLQQLREGINDKEFIAAHSRVLGIGSPYFFIVKGEMTTSQMEDDELHATIDGIEAVIPLKYIFGNTAREASGWFNIDDFQNTTDFNAVSAEMNRYIREKVVSTIDKDDDASTNTPEGGNTKGAEAGTVSFTAAVAIPKDVKDVKALTLIPFTLTSGK